MHPVTKKLREIMQAKQTNLCVAADLVKADEILGLAEKIGEKICVLKTHVDIIEDFTPEFPKKLREIADEKNFLIFEDRKFADIGNTVSLQFSSGVYKIADWADFVNAHTIVGPGIVAGLEKANQKSGLILLAQMTPEGNLFDKEYALKTIEIAKENPNFVVGFIGSADKPETLSLIREKSGEDLLIMTPGVKLANPPQFPFSKGGSPDQVEGQGDSLGQTYNTPEKAISNGADVIIVGRGIIQADDPVAEAEKYRVAGWEARISQKSEV